MVNYICSRCGEVEALDTKSYICKCGGLYDLDFKPQNFSLDLVDRGEWSIFRYRKFFPLDNDLWRGVSLGEGMTPVVALDDRVLLKLDYAMPTLSFKDRGAALVMWLCKTIGVDSVIQDSSGNAGNSIAAYAARTGIGCEIFVPMGTSPKKINMIKSHGAHVNIFEGTRDQTAQACRDKARSEEKFYASHVFNPFFYQGTKTYIYEVFEQLGRIPDNLFIPLGNGTLFIGAVLALKELLSSGLILKMPKIFVVQSEHCAPFYHAKIQGLESIPQIQIKPTLAEGIAIGEPMRAEQILKEIHKHNMEVVSAKEDSILSARDALAKAGFYVEHTTAATYGAYLDYIKENNLEGDVLIPLCGAGLKSDK
jgi:threonine synthase